MPHKSHHLVVAALTGAILLSGAALAANPPAPDNTFQLISAARAVEGTGVFGSFTYDSYRNCVWIGVYGSGQGIRRYDIATDTVTQAIDQITMDRLARASDMANGAVWAGDGGAQRCFGLLLNPKTLTLTLPAPANLGGGSMELTYPPGTLLFSCDQPSKVMKGGSTYRPDWTKMMYRYDMRIVYEPTDPTDSWGGQLDYATAQNGAGSLMGAYGIVDWNDPFTVVCNAQQFVLTPSQLGRVPTTGRQATWSTDGLSLYWAASDPYSGGVWKVDATTGGVSWIYASLGGSPSLNTEVGVVHTSVRDLDPANPATGDQIIFRGTTGAKTGDGAVLPSNGHGMSYIIDDGTSVTGPYTLLRKCDFRKYMQWNGKYNPRSQKSDGTDPAVNPPEASAPDTWSMVVGEDGTIYFTDNASQGGLWRYDPLNRLSGFRSQAQHRRWYYSIAPTTTSTSKQVAHPQLRSAIFTGLSGEFPMLQFLYRDNGTTSQGLGGVAGVNIFKPGDFNRDNVLDQADVDLLSAALAVPVGTFSTGTAPNIKYYEAPAISQGDLLLELETADSGGDTTHLAQYLDYLKCDMNNNALVTAKDRAILGQYFGKDIRDFNWDGVVDAADEAHYLACSTGFARVPNDQLATCDDADLDGDTKVNLKDWYAWNGWAPCDFNRDGYVNTADLPYMRACAKGSRVPQANTDCTLTDLDRDADIDMDDFGIFQVCYSGDTAADPNCGI